MHQSLLPQKKKRFSKNRAEKNLQGNSLTLEILLCTSTRAFWVLYYYEKRYLKIHLSSSLCPLFIRCLLRVVFRISYNTSFTLRLSNGPYSFDFSFRSLCYVMWMWIYMSSFVFSFISSFQSAWLGFNFWLRSQSQRTQISFSFIPQFLYAEGTSLTQYSMSTRIIFVLLLPLGPSGSCHLSSVIGGHQ